MSTSYPVHVEVISPPHFDRVQVAVRVVLIALFAWFGISVTMLAGGVYLALPAIAACAVSWNRADYGRAFAPQLWRVLAWSLRFSAYMMILVDRFPLEDDGTIRFDVQYTAKPSVGTALRRLLTSIPSAIALAALWIVSSVVWIFAAMYVLVGVSQSTWMLGFQRGILRWQACLLAYHVSFVDEYPPFSIDNDDGHGPTLNVAANPT